MLYFQHHYLSLQCHMIFRNLKFTDLLLKKHFLLLSMMKTVVLFDHFYGHILWILSKEKLLLEAENFCNITNVLTVTLN